MGLKWHGRQIMELIEKAGARGVGEGAREIAEASQDRVLVQTGELKRSQRIHHDETTAVVYYTDSKAAAAHENLAVNVRTHRNPNARAKFLESAANDKRGEVLDEVADAIRRVL